MPSTRQHILDARRSMRQMELALSRMESLDGARNAPAMSGAIRDLLCANYTLQQEMRPLQNRVRQTVQKAHAKADAAVAKPRCGKAAA